MSLSTESTRPLLLPQNRRLRHLRGIYFRNLSFARPRGKSADDSVLNKGSPGKLETLKSGHHLQHAASSESLRERTTKARRRSTNLANQNPVTRQKQLELAIESRAADVFFSLHVEGEEGPIYISEVKERAMNFNFIFFDLSRRSPSITRSAEVTVKIWAKRRGEWIFLLEETVDLRSLNFIGTLQNQPMPPNCLIFHLIDGVYSLQLPAKAVQPKQGTQLPTSSYNALMKLANLDASIQDALATQEALESQINEILEHTPRDVVPQAQERVKLLNKCVAAQQRANKAAQARRDELRESIDARRAAIAKGCEAQKKVAVHIEDAASKLPEARAAVESTREQIRGQRRRICEDVIQIFPITPSPSGTTLSFQICGLDLPNTNYDPTISTQAENTLAAALGHVAKLVDVLQYYLGVPLPYPITPYGSRSSIRDDISKIADVNRSFPLFLRGGASAQFRFDYGWFLLNKDIEALCASASLKVVDIRHTLPNLKYLLYVCSAGTDELPERKRGGVRGLLAGRMKGKVGSLTIDDGASSAGASRRGSAESEAMGKHRDELRRALGGERPSSLVIEESTNPGSTSTAPRSPSPIELPFDDGAKLTLRTKGLRENVVK